MVSPSEYKHPMFSVGLFDRYGDVFAEGIYLHYGDTAIKVSDNVDGFKAHAELLLSMVNELREIESS